MTILACLALAVALAVETPSRHELVLDGVWQITTADAASPDAEWIPARVPAAFEEALGTQFDGIATYRTSFTVPDTFSGERFWLHFDAVATHADVFLNGSYVAQHLGGWTPFRADVSRVIRRGQANDLVVKVDERVGHNTQGFLPAIGPHFGGIWQSVKLIGCAASAIDDLRLLAVGDANGVATFEASVLGSDAGVSLSAELHVSDPPLRVLIPQGGRATLEARGITPWEPAAPRTYAVDFVLSDQNGAERDRVRTTIAFRTVATRGHELLLNGRPLNVRGVLEWGWFPPRLAPTPEPDVIATSIDEVKARGFNLVKFCLWIPPRRIVEQFDAAGVLTWQEYPTWHPTFDDQHRDELLAEFDEFFHLDRNHPSIVLRSLTCETGPSASIDVIRALDARAKERIPGALIEDDSSWIGWNRVSDIWDDHPYGNNDDWVARLKELTDFIAEREAKPLVLGEAIAADTWLDPAQIADVRARNGYELPIVFEDHARWERAMRARTDDATIDALRRWSLRFAMNERKDQIETFREVVPDGGYVVSVARDFRTAQMGLADHTNQWKWPREDFAWHGDSMLLLPHDAPRALLSDTTVRVRVKLAHHGATALPAGTLTWAFGAANGSRPTSAVEPGGVVELGLIPLVAPRVTQPTPIDLTLILDANGVRARNRWTLWVLPRHPETAPDVLVVDALSDDVLRRLEGGARVLLKTAEVPFSFVTTRHWLLRGAPWFPPHALTKTIPPELFLDLGVKDVHPKGLIPAATLLPHVDPIVAFWDTHDSAVVKDWLIAFETHVGRGRLLVSSFRHDGSVAGAWLERAFLLHLANGPEPASALPPDLVTAIADRMAARTMDLTPDPWEFRIDAQPGVAENPWQAIRVGQSWEGQGFSTLDGWVTYRRTLDIAPDWAGEPLFVNFEGVDDAFEVYFDGARVGMGGDIDKRETAFAQASSHRLSEAVTAGSHVLEVRVFDWYGAGGIHRPVNLSTRPLGIAAEFLRGR